MDATTIGNSWYWVKIFRYCLFFQCQCAKMPISGGVWMVSGWGQRVSGRCLGVYLCHINWKQLNKSRDIKLLPFLPVPSTAPKTPISGGCLDNVWGCLDGVWMRSKGVWEMSGVYRCHINWKQLNKSHNIKLLPFLSVLSNAQKLRYLWVSGWCLDGV